MQVFETIGEFRSALDSARHAGHSIGLVPTMGYLHEGHLSLMAASRADNDLTAVTIFVNPLQFAAGEDLDSYPRDMEGDLTAAESAGVDIVFAPPHDQMYPREPLTTVTVSGLSEMLEGQSRPTHFAGVTTVVAKLFNMAGTCRAYFGEKDFQQLTIVRRMVADLDFPVEIVGCPIVREPDGLAMSSRNVYLSPDERTAATVLHRALDAGAAAVRAGERDPSVVSALMGSMIGAEPLAELDYAEVVDPSTLARPASLAGEVRLLVASRFGRPRLLDNLGAVAPV